MVLKILNRHSPPVAAPSTAFRGWAVVAISLLCQNMGNGIAYGAFGALLLVTEAHFAVSRGLAAAGMSAIVLSFALSSPLVGALLQRVSVRRIMLYGAAISAVGYAGLALSPIFAVAILSYVVIGIGLCLVAENGPLTLVSRWFISDRAKVLGIVNLPIAVLVMPIAVSGLLSAGYDRRAILFAIAAGFVALAAVVAFLVDRPEAIGQRPWKRNDPSAKEAEIAQAAPLLTSRDFAKDPRFWLVCLGVGCISGCGISFVVHFIAFGSQRGMSVEWASMVLSIYAASGIAGNLLFGALADRLGGVRSLAITAFLLTLLWVALALAPAFLLLPIAILLGLCVVPILTLYGTTLVMLFGPSNVSKAYGLGYLLKLPFMFGMPPLVGAFFDLTGTYRLGFLMIALAVALSCVSFCLVLYLQRRSSTAAAANS